MIPEVALNSDIVRASSLYLDLTSNRGFLYGDGFFETIRFTHGAIFQLQKHFKRIQEGLSDLNLELDIKLLDQVLDQYINFISKKHQLKEARINIHIFRSSAGKFSANSNQAHFLIKAEKLDHSYNFNEKGLQLCAFKKLFLPADQTNRYKGLHNYIYIKAAHYCKSQQCDSAIIFNTHQTIAECFNANIFCVKDDIVYTPQLDQGCLNGVMRNTIIKLCQKNNISVVESSIDEPFLLNSDEVFLTNVVSGISWAMGYQKRRYLNKISTKLTRLLNDKIYTNILQHS